MNKLKNILQSKYLFKIIAIICLGYSLIMSHYLPLNSKYEETETTITGKIIQYQIDGDKLKLTLKSKEKTIIYYYFHTEKEKNKYEEQIELGTVLKVKGQITKAPKNTIPNGFNYRKYLKYHNINYCIYANEIEILQNNTSVLYHIKNKLISHIDKTDHTGYLRTFIIGDKTLLNEDILEKYQQNGISHLFSISGMHVNFIVGIIMFILKKISYSNIYKYGIIIPFLLFYLFLTGFGASVLRTTIMFIVFAINKCYNLKIKKLDLMLITLIIAIIINPLIIYDIGFQFSYIISFSLIIFSKKTAHIKKKWLKKLIASIICFLVSFPICIYNYQEVNILSILLNLIMIPIISLIIFPASLITAIVPFLYPIYEMIIQYFEQATNILSNIKIFELTLPKPSLSLIILYYAVIYISMINIKYFWLFVLVLIIHKNQIYIDSNTLLTVLDVGQGDSIFIKLPNNKGNILIDTGGRIDTQKKETWKQKQNDYSIANDNIVPYLKSNGITKLNYLIITHGDYDHMGEAINLVNNFKVEKVIFNCGEFNELEKELIKVLDKKTIPYYFCIKELNIDDNKLYFLNNKDYGNENDNSSVIYTELSNHKFLFMGDAGLEVEEDLIKKYNLQDIDVLKVGHHGSKTSSGKEFINEINPKYSIISVGKNNRYGHPNKEVLNVLEDSKIYRTDQDGSIMFRINKDKLKIETCVP